MKRYFGKVLARFVAGVLVAGLLSWGAYASSALDSFAFLTVKEFGGDSFFQPVENSPIKLRSIAVYRNWEHAPMANIEVEITGPRSYGRVYCLADFRGGQWCVAYAPPVFTLEGIWIDPGVPVSQHYGVPLQTLMGPGPFRLYAGGLGHIDIPSLRDVQWEEGSVVLD